MKQSWIESHLEQITQNVVGLIVGFIILQFYGLSVSQSVGLQLVFFVASYSRGYLIRRLFNNYGHTLFNWLKSVKLKFKRKGVNNAES